MALRDFARHFSGKWLLLIFVAAAAVSLVSRYGMSVDGPRNTKAGTIKVETVATGLSHPWGLAFLPDGRMLVTERSGTLRLVSKDGKLSEPLSGVPKVVAAGQGGLLDVAIDPDFKSNSLVYLTYSEPGEGGAGTAVARGKLGESGLDGVEVIFRQEPKVEGGNHFGSRLAFAPDGKLFVTLGERFTFTPAQDLTNDLGKIVRINPDGSIPKDNPFVGTHRCPSGDLVLRPPQSARRRHSSRDRQAVGDRVRSEGRGRAQHSASRPELRLAGGELGHRTMTARTFPSRRPTRNSPTPSITGTR